MYYPGITRSIEGDFLCKYGSYYFTLSVWNPSSSY